MASTAFSVARSDEYLLPPEQHRGGLLSHASMLLSNSTGADSHPVRRAVWIRDRLLNDPPAPPPPDVPSLEEANPEFHQLSVREQLEIHRTKESCNNCHRHIDGWGIALENFDAVGKWRTDIPRQLGDNSEMHPVNATVVLPGGQEVVGADGLKTYLASERKQEFARSLVSRLLTYALGRSLELSDQEAVDDVLGQFARDDYRLKQLVHKVLCSANRFRRNDVAVDWHVPGSEHRNRNIRHDWKILASRSTHFSDGNRRFAGFAMDGVHGRLPTTSRSIQRTGRVESAPCISDLAWDFRRKTASRLSGAGFPMAKAGTFNSRKP